MTMWLLLPCSYYSAWHDQWLVETLSRGSVPKNLFCFSRKTWMSFWGGCHHPPVTFELRGRDSIDSSCLFFIQALIPQTLVSLEAPHAIVSFYIILLLFFFLSSWLQPLLTVRAGIFFFLPHEWTQPVEGCWTRWRGPVKMEKKNPVWWGGDEEWRRNVSHRDWEPLRVTFLFCLFVFLRETIVCWH